MGGTKEKSQFIIAGVILLVLLISLLGLSRWITPVFQINDDMTIRSILNGDYTGTPDGHAIYMLYPLSGVLSLLYRIMDLPWLELFFAGSIILSMFLIIYYSGNKLISFLLCVALLYPMYFQQHYTVIAALLAGTAIFLAYKVEKPYGAILLWLLSYAVRREVALLCIPFWGLVLLWRVCSVPKESAKEERKTCAMTLFGGIAGLLLCMLINEACYSSAQWREHKEFQNARVSLYDYTDFIPSEYYRENYEEFGLTQDQYNIWTTYNILLDKALDTERMQQLAVDITAHMKKNRDNVAWFQDAIRSYVSDLRYNRPLFTFFCLFGYAALGVIALWKKQWKQLLLLFCMGVGRNVVCIYLIMQGRFPDRIALAFFLLELLSMWGQLHTLVSFEAFTHKTIIKKICFAGTCVLLVLIGQYSLKEAGNRSVRALAHQTQWESIKSYCRGNEEITFFGNVFTIQEYAGIPYEETVSNLYMLGCWTANSPVADTVLQSLNSEDAAEALICNENVRLLVEEDRDIEYLKNYFTNRFGEVVFEPVGEINCSDSKMIIDYRIRLVGTGSF